MQWIVKIRRANSLFRYLPFVLAVGFSTLSTGCSEEKPPALTVVEAQGQKQLWTCGMHPQVIVEEPGFCPICDMKLTPVKQETMAAMTVSENEHADHDQLAQTMSVEDKVILYWHAPMDPTYITDQPGKSPMGMDLIPVYEGETGSAGPSITIDPVTLQNIGVQTTLVERVNLYRSIRTVGHLDYNEESYSRVNIKFSGWIEKLFADQTGQEIHKGDAMLEIYSPELVSTQEEYLLAFRNVEKLENSTFQSVAGSARSLLDAVRRRLLYWDITEQQILDLEERGAVKKNLTLYAPTNGIIIEKMAELGMRITPGMDLYRMADLSTIWAYAHIYEYDASWIRPGQSIVMDLPYSPGRTYEGRIDYIYPYLDQKSRDIKIRLVFPNPRRQLKPQMYANIQIAARIGGDVIALPNEAIIRTGERNLVFVALGDGKFEPRTVVLGLEGQDGLVQVIGGISAGEEVVTSAQFLMDSESRMKEAIQKMLKDRLK